MEEIKTPLLIIHSRDDEIIPFKFGQALFASANEPKQFLEISGNHNEGFMLSGSDYVEGIDKFLRDHLDR